LKKLLLIDDDVELCEMLTEYLGSEGFGIDVMHDGKSGVEKALSEHYEVIVLDVMLPELNGFEVLKHIRAKSQTAVLMLTARGDDVDRIVGLEMGADDYLPKPFNPRELVARLRAILRRQQQNLSEGNEAKNINKLYIGELEVDPSSRLVKLSGEIIHLTSTEYNLLELLVRNAGQLVTKEILSKQALNRKLTSYDRSIDMHMSNIRRKLGDSLNEQPLIKTIRGIGYQFTGS
jgi:two-component system response regulator CpxR